MQKLGEGNDQISELQDCLRFGNDHQLAGSATCEVNV